LTPPPVSKFKVVLYLEQVLALGIKYRNASIISIHNIDTVVLGYGNRLREEELPVFAAASSP